MPTPQVSMQLFHNGSKHTSNTRNKERTKKKKTLLNTNKSQINDATPYYIKLVKGGLKARAMIYASHVCQILQIYYKLKGLTEEKTGQNRKHNRNIHSHCVTLVLNHLIT